MKKILLVASLLFLTACGGGGSSSGPIEETIPGTMIPARFLGTYNGTVNASAEATGGLSLSDSVPLTITVTSDGNIRFEVDGRSITIGLTNEGSFSGNIDASAFIEECTGFIGVVGTVDGTTASGTIEGDGECEEGIVEVDVEVTGDFSATK